jgi:hypothetical protein
MPPLIITLGSAGAKPYGYTLGTSEYVFPGGNQSWGSILELTQFMAGSTTTTGSPTAGGTLTINGQSLGSYDYYLIGTEGGTTTVSSFTEASWFTATADTRSMIIVVRGNLTVNSGITFTPTNRKLFVVIYVTGTLTNNGSIVMNQRGANHSGSGSSGGLTTEATIRIATGTYSSVSNPQIPNLGGAGGPASGNPGATGSAGTDGGLGGGGAGAGNTGTGGAGAQGTAFSGGPGGGGASQGGTGSGGVARGGAGGNAGSPGNWTGGGGGNPHGNNVGNVNCQIVGTGGSLIVLCGTLAGNGAFQAIGGRGCASNGAGPDGAGGGTGGGSMNILTNTNSSTVTTSAAGGAAVGGGGGTGGAGGAGTARILTGSGI